MHVLSRDCSSTVPTDNAWSITDPTATILHQSGGLLASTLHTTGPVCIPDGSEFVITDSWGDGLITPASYSVEVISSACTATFASIAGGWQSRAHTLTCQTDSPPISPPVISPTVSRTASPTISPTTSPATSPTTTGAPTTPAPTTGIPCVNRATGTGLTNSNTDEEVPCNEFSLYGLTCAYGNLAINCPTVCGCPTECEDTTTGYSSSGAPILCPDMFVYNGLNCGVVELARRCPLTCGGCTTPNPTANPTTDPTIYPTKVPTTSSTTSPTTSPTRSPTHSPPACPRNCGTADRGGGSCRPNGRCLSCNDNRLRANGRCVQSLSCKGRQVQTGVMTGQGCRCLNPHCHFCSRAVDSDVCRVVRTRAESLG